MNNFIIYGISKILIKSKFTWIIKYTYNKGYNEYLNGLNVDWHRQSGVNKEVYKYITGEIYADGIVDEGKG